MTHKVESTIEAGQFAIYDVAKDPYGEPSQHYWDCIVYIESIEDGNATIFWNNMLSATRPIECLRPLNIVLWKDE